MGKVFSCLPFKKRGNCIDSPDKRDGDVRKEATWIERSDPDTTGTPHLVNRTHLDAGLWQLEDIENEDHGKRAGHKHCATPGGFKKSTMDTGVCSSSSASIAQHDSLDSGFADVPMSSVDLLKDKGMGLNPHAPDTTSPRKRTKDSDAMPVSLRQTHEDYMKRLDKQRSMTRALLTSSSWSPVPSHQLVQKEHVITDDHLRRMECQFYQEFPVADVELTPVPSFLKIPDDNELHEPVILREDNLKRLEDAFYQEFPVKDISKNTITHSQTTQCKDIFWSKDKCDSPLHVPSKKDIDENSLVDGNCDSTSDIGDDSSTEEINAPGSSDEDSDGNINIDERRVKLHTLVIENIIEEEREDLVEFCSHLILQLVDNIYFKACYDKSVDCIGHANVLGDINGSYKPTDTLAEHRNTRPYTCIRRINSSTDIILAMDICGIGHPMLKGCDFIVAIDRNGIGHPFAPDNGDAIAIDAYGIGHHLSNMP